MKSFIRVTFVSLTLIVPALAEKRRAEQIRQQDCAHKADVAKVTPRERTAFLLQCLEADAANK